MTPSHRVAVDGKLLSVGGHACPIRGVTYGAFEPGVDGAPFPSPNRVDEDFRAMSACGVNAVRVYDAPPPWFLDLALDHDLRVVVGSGWEQHVAFLADRSRSADIVRRVRAEVAPIAGHPAILCYAVGNEIPSSIVRWHGKRAIEGFIRRLCAAVKELDPDGLTTYSNYPTTEYLQLPFLDIVSFNVFLESPEEHERYVARLQNLAGDRPLLITELGLDSRRNSEARQAEIVEQNVRATMRGGCAGAFVFAWTDDWHRGGAVVDDWDFGLVDRDRRPKPALTAVSRAYAETPFAPDDELPGVTVVVCTHNGARTLARCLDGLATLDYPTYEVIVVDDGSTDATPVIARDAGARVLRTAHAGLSAARNLGLRVAQHPLVAYIDDDAWPHPLWLRYAVRTLLDGGYDGVGGPNIPPPDASVVEEAVARGPGGPIHVLLSDTDAEHIPGCNMVFDCRALIAIGGFDPQFTSAGDDVDVCWRLYDAGFRLGFSPAAVVWHQRRTTVRGYLRQQRGYGKAEALLERKWPERYNGHGHVQWSGQVYGETPTVFEWRKRIDYGTWGAGLFQSLYQRRRGQRPVPLMPEWYLAAAGLVALAAPGLVHSSPVYSPVAQAIVGAVFAALAAWAWLAVARASAASILLTRRELLVRAVTGVLFVTQPMARLLGRVRHGLTPWRRQRYRRLSLPFPRQLTVWDEEWRAPAARLSLLEARAERLCKQVARGGGHDRWDIDARSGLFAGARVRMGVEEHGQGRQLVRFRVWPVYSRRLVPLLAGPAAALVLGVRYDFVTGEFAAVLTMLVIVRALHEAAAGVAAIVHAATDPDDYARHRPAETRSTGHVALDRLTVPAVEESA